MRYVCVAFGVGVGAGVGRVASRPTDIGIPLPHHTTINHLLPRTRLILFKILNTGLLFQEVQGVVKTGKESFVYFAPAAPAPSAATASATTTFVVGGDAPGGGPDGRGAAAAAVDLTNEEEEVEDEADSYVDDAEEDEGASGSEAGGSTAPSLAPPPSSSASAAAAGAPPLPEWDRSRGCAIKVFKTTLNEFSKRGEYVEGDPRYHESLKFNKQTSRRMFKLWAEKEYRNLLRMHRAGACAAFCVCVVVLSSRMPNPKAEHPPQNKPRPHHRHRPPLPRAPGAEGARAGHVLPRHGGRLALPAAPRGQALPQGLGQVLPPVRACVHIRSW